MWICHNEGFVSIVTDRQNKDRLLVRARRREDLEAVLKVALEAKETEIFSDTGSDYKWRAFVSRDIVAQIIGDFVLNINYDNFKNSVRGHDLHDLYSEMWNLHWHYQYNDPRNVGERRKKRH